MAQTIMIFDFGTNEEAAQQARHKIEGWKQGFRLGDKMMVKFEREEAAGDESASEGNGKSQEVAAEKKPAKNQKSKKAAAKQTKETKEVEEPQKDELAGRVRILVRLGFSDHEKLSQQRWLDRIPAEEPFKSAKGETIRHNDPEFAKSAELFESLD